MRIKKPSGTKQEYKIYSNIEERDLVSSKLENGQEVKILDASSDENIGSGWAIYKYDKESSLFDLLEKEEQPVIPEFPEIPTVFEPDNVSIETTPNNILTATDAVISMRTDVRILEDFDYSIRPLGDNLYLEPIGGQRTVKVEVNGVIQYLSLSSQQIGFNAFDNGGKGKRVHWNMWGKISTTNTLATNMPYETNADGSVITTTPLNIDSQMIIMQVSAQVHSTGTVKPELIRIHKYWKKSVVPAEERIIIPEASPLADNVTITSKIAGTPKLVVPELQHAYYENIKIMKGFSLQANVDVAAKQVNFTFNDSTNKLSIPVSTPSGTKYLKLTPFSMNSAFFNSCKKGAAAYITVSGLLMDTDAEQASGMQLSKYNDGSATDTKPRDIIADKLMLVCQVRFDVLLQSYWPWNQKMVTIFKTWEQALAPAEERIQTESYNLDKVTLFETRLSEKDSIFAPELCNANPVNIKLLEDFDFTFSTALTFTGSKPYLQCELVGGNRLINVVVDGVNKKMSLASEGVVMQDIFNTNYHGKWTYFTLLAPIDDGASGIHPLGTEYENDNGDVMHVTQYPNQTQFKLAQIGVKFESDGETLDLKNIHVMKYWKKSLAPFDELMQDYQQRIS